MHKLLAKRQTSTEGVSIGKISVTSLLGTRTRFSGIAFISLHDADTCHTVADRLLVKELDNRRSHVSSRPS